MSSEIHQIVDIELKDGAELHRFDNVCGVAYSAIYLDGREVFSCERERESSMIVYWQKSNLGKIKETEENTNVN